MLAPSWICPRFDGAIAAQHRGPCTSLSSIRDGEHALDKQKESSSILRLDALFLSCNLKAAARGEGEEALQRLPTATAKLHPSITQLLAPCTSGKPNTQILSGNDTMFSCFLPDDRSDLIIASEPAVLIKLKSHVACSKLNDSDSNIIRRPLQQK